MPVERQTETELHKPENVAQVRRRSRSAIRQSDIARVLRGVLAAGMKATNLRVERDGSINVTAVPDAVSEGDNELEQFRKNHGYD